MTQTTKPDLQEICRKLVDKGLTEQEGHLAAAVLQKCWMPDLIENLSFGGAGLSTGMRALRKGRPIVVDSPQLHARLDSQRLAQMHSGARHVAADRDVVEVSKILGMPPEVVAMRKSAQLYGDAVFVFSESDSALNELADIIKKGDANPALIVTLTKGDRVAQTGCPYLRVSGPQATLDSLAALVNGLIRVAAEQPAN